MKYYKYIMNIGVRILRDTCRYLNSGVLYFINVSIFNRDYTITLFLIYIVLGKCYEKCVSCKWLIKSLTIFS